MNIEKLNVITPYLTLALLSRSLLSKPDRPHKTPAPHVNCKINKKAHTVFSFNDSPEKLIKIKSPHMLTAEVISNGAVYNVTCPINIHDHIVVILKACTHIYLDSSQCIEL